MKSQLDEDLTRFAEALDLAAPPIDYQHATGERETSGPGTPRRPALAALLGCAAAVALTVAGLAAIAVERGSEISQGVGTELPVADVTAPDPGVANPSTVSPGASAVTREQEAADGLDIGGNDVLDGSTWIVFDSLPVGFEMVSIDEEGQMVSYFNEQDASIVVSVRREPASATDAATDEWIELPASAGTFEFLRGIGSQATAVATFSGVERSEAESLLSNLAYLDERPQTLLDQQGAFLAVGTFGTGSDAVSLKVQIAAPWYCARTSTSDGATAVRCGIRRNLSVLAFDDAFYSSVEASGLVVARIGGTVSDEVTAVEVTFSDGQSVAVEPQSSAQHPGWNFWYLEAPTTADERAPIDQVVQSVVALDASGEVVSSIEAT